jgi:hypothetical protein
MDLQKKAQIAAQAIDSISRHDDEDAAVRHAFLDQVANHIAAEKAGIDKRVVERVGQLAGTQASE